MKLRRYLISKVSMRIREKIISNLKYDFLRDSNRLAIKHFNGKLIDAIEIGVLSGRNSKRLLDTLNIRKLYLIDPYTCNDECPDVDKFEEKAKELLKDYKNKVFIKATSDNAFYDLKNKKFDFIYVDGSHYYDQVLRDIKNYYLLLKSGGIICGHDMICHKGVSDAVLDFCFETGLKPLLCGEDWIISKDFDLIEKKDYTQIHGEVKDE